MEALLRAFRGSNPPDTTMSTSDDVAALEADEPPDDRVPNLSMFKKENVHRLALKPGVARRESLLTQSLKPESDTSPASPRVPRGMSTTSCHSFASTAELTSDVESPLRSITPSPPPPETTHIQFSTNKPIDISNHIVIAPLTSEDKPTIIAAGDAAAEKTLGRRRCIMFACNDAAAPPPPVSQPPKPVVSEPTQPVQSDAPVRKPRISFACPMRPSDQAPQGKAADAEKRRRSSPAPTTNKPATNQTQLRRTTESAILCPKQAKSVAATVATGRPSPPPIFEEFGTSFQKPEPWVQHSTEANKPKLTVNDCLKKEIAIRKIGQEVEEEAEAEARELDALENEMSDNDEEDDDFAPSDQSTDGNESDDENGFADSDDDSDADSEYQFWAPSTSAAATGAENGTHFSNRPSIRSRASSTSSTVSLSTRPSRRLPPQYRPKASKPIRMRPGTPELPDSTDFVCGTFDEDRPLEAAYISFRNMKRKEKQLTLPQDIDPSFPTTDPEDEEDEVSEAEPAEESEQPMFSTQFDGSDEDLRGRSRKSDARQTLVPSVATVGTIQAQPPATLAGGVAPRRNTCRSPPPPKANLAHISTVAKRRSKSPAPAPVRSLFPCPSQRLRSPPPMTRGLSPRGSPAGLKTIPLGITLNRLAQRPSTDKTSSLPHTPNPFFKNWNYQSSTRPSRVQSLAASPGMDDLPADVHVRGPVDIVIGLEKKRQKRKEKYWRQHCKKLQKHPEKKLPHGKGLERMRQHGLECAERFKGYNASVQPPLVLSI